MDDLLKLDLSRADILDVTKEVLVEKVDPKELVELMTDTAINEWNGSEEKRGEIQEYISEITKEAFAQCCNG